MKMGYEPVRSILVWSAAFCLFGPLPRLLGMLETKPEHADWVPYMDAAAGIVFIAALVWAVVAITNNAIHRKDNDPL